MEGTQKAAYEQMMDIVHKIKEGFYGENYEMDIDPLWDDFEEMFNSIDRSI